MDGELNSFQRENLALHSALKQQQAATAESPLTRQSQLAIEENLSKLQTIII